MHNKPNILEDFKINVKIKLSALWTSLMFLYIYGDYFELYLPKKVEGLINGRNLLDSPMKLFVAAFMLAIAALMISLSIILKPKINRLLNLIFGFSFTGVTLMVASSSLSEWEASYFFYAITESVMTLIIVQQAWTWKRLKQDSV